MVNLYGFTIFFADCKVFWLSNIGQNIVGNSYYICTVSGPLLYLTMESIYATGEKFDLANILNFSLYVGEPSVFQENHPLKHTNFLIIYQLTSLLFYLAFESVQSLNQRGHNVLQYCLTSPSTNS